MTAPPGTGRRATRLSRLALAAWVGFWVLAFILTHTPKVPGGVLRFPFADKVAHALLYATLTTLGASYLRASGRWASLRVPLGWAAVYAAYAGLDEWLQSFVGRSMSLGDWLADLTGIVLATAWAARARPPA